MIKTNTKETDVGTYELLKAVLPAEVTQNFKPLKVTLLNMSQDQRFNLTSSELMTNDVIVHVGQLVTALISVHWCLCLSDPDGFR